MGNKGLRYAIRDGFVGLKRHPLILLVSITTMFIMLVLLGAFVIFAVNANQILQEAGEIPPIEIQFEVGVDPNLVVGLAEQFEDNPNIVEYKVMSPEDNMDDFMELIEKDELFDEFDFKQHIPWSILLRLSDPKLGGAFHDEVIGYPGVYDVMMETALMQTLETAIQSVSVVSMVVFAVLVFVSILVINNMIKVIALSRSTELSIMKTMGATDLYIRIPFIIEGLFVSLVASAVSLLVLFLSYNILLRNVSAGFIAKSLLPLQAILWPAIIAVTAFAVFIGGITSALSVKRYIQV